MKDVLLTALYRIAEEQANGNTTIDLLSKACETYKLKTGFDDGYGYQLLISKSISDQLNGLEQDEDIAKSILPGETKVIDGVVYKWTATKPGSKTAFAWHVANQMNGKTVGKGGSLTPQQVDQLQAYVNDLFPADLKSLKTVKAAGGSTGAQLVQDVRGNQYILKKGTNQQTNNDHVKNEYLANQLYDIAGIRVPDYQLYDDNGTAVLLSKFIPNARVFGPKDYEKVAKNFLADCLFANWDAYQNDNILIDSAGRVVRVDNGGTLAYRAHGALKTFDGDIVSTFTSMKAKNPSIAGKLDDDEIIRQINELRKKKNDLVNYLMEVGETQLAKTIGQRIDNMRQIEDDINSRKSVLNRKVLPRKLKSAKEMYRVFDDKELEKLWDDADGSGYRSKLTNTIPGKGHALLSQIAAARGFDARPRVVDDAEYWKLVAENAANGRDTQLFRGLSPDSRNWSNKGNITIEAAVQSLLYNDTCFFGTQAVHGQGIYAHVNDYKGASQHSRTDYKNSRAYAHALDYAHDGGIGKGAVVKGCLEPDAKVIDFEDLFQMVKTDVPDTDPKELLKLQGEIKKLDSKINKIDEEMSHVSDRLIQEAYKRVQYNQTEYMSYQTVSDSVDWDKRDSFGERDIPKFDDFVLGDIANLVTANGGTVTKKNGLVVFKMPHDDEEISISEYQYDGPYSIKKKNAFTSGYNGAVKRFEDWFERTHVKYAEQARQEAIDSVGTVIAKLKQEKQDYLHQRYDVEQELQTLTAGSDANANKGIKEALYVSCVKEKNKAPLGIYAALHGYDAIKVKDGNGRGNSFYVILNRSKVVINKNVDMYV